MGMGVIWAKWGANEGVGGQGSRGFRNRDSDSRQTDERQEARGIYLLSVPRI